MSDSVVNALSVDVEEYYHALVFADAVKGRAVGHLESRVEESVERLLTLFNANAVKATFFVLGQVAADHPAMVQKIAGEGHEIASHGYRHELVSDRSPAEFRADVHDTKALLEDITGETVLGYRAPNFSIGPRQAWAYDILLDEGYCYDSSVYPIHHDRYGDPTAPRFPFELRRRGKATLTEVPIATTRFLGASLPIGGGGYFRLLPLRFIRWGIQRVNGREGRPIVFYFHPWELDPDQPRPSMFWHHRIRHYVGLRQNEAKLSCLLREVRFNTIRRIFCLQ